MAVGVFYQIVEKGRVSGEELLCFLLGNFGQEFSGYLREVPQDADFTIQILFSPTLKTSQDKYFSEAGKFYINNFRSLDLWEDPQFGD